MNTSSFLLLSITVLFPIIVYADQSMQKSDANSFPLTHGLDQTIVDINTIEWQPLKVEGLPDGAEISVLRGNLETGMSESVLRLPTGYHVPVHNHTSDEVYVWLQGTFTLILSDNRKVNFDGPAYINFPGSAPMHGLQCRSKSGCLLYLRYTRPFDIHYASNAAKSNDSRKE